MSERGFLLPTLLLFVLFLATPWLQAQDRLPGVVSTTEAEKFDPHCMLYIDRNLILTFSIGRMGKPVLNVINFSPRELVVEARNLTFELEGGGRKSPTTLRIATGIPGESIPRAYFTIRPKSSFYLEPGGMEESLARIRSLSVRVGPTLYHPAAVRREIYDTMLLRMERLDVASPSPARDLKRLDIPLMGKKEGERDED